MAQALKPLRVGLIVKHTPIAYERDGRNMGLFSYAVPEFTWEHIQLKKHGLLNTADYARQFDLLFEEDAGNWPNYIGHALPIVYYAIDSTLSHEHHYLPRYQQSKKADLCLVDHDKLERFGYRQRPVRRLSYCVNDKLFYNRGLERDIDVNFHCGGRHEGRKQVRQLLAEYCAERGLTYVSGTVDLPTYAEHMARSKVVVVWPRTETNRPHRVMDAMASRACVISADHPYSEGDWWREGHTFLLTKAIQNIPDVIESSFEPVIVSDNGKDLTFDDYPMWQFCGETGSAEIKMGHTWAVRARELRQLLHEELGL